MAPTSDTWWSLVAEIARGWMGRASRAWALLAGSPGVGPADLCVPLSHPSALDPLPCAYAAPGIGPTWRGAGARLAPNALLGVGAAFLSWEGPWSLRALLQAGHHLAGRSSVFSAPELKEGDPAGPPSSVGVSARSFASGRTLRRGSRRSGCRNGLGSSRWRAGEPDPASKVAQVEDGCKPEDPPGPRRPRPREGSARPSSAKEDSRGTGSIPKIARTGLPATANGATVADGMKRPLHIECSNFVPAGGGYAWLRAGGRQADPSTLEST
jgi:hypothetical protein